VIVEVLNVCGLAKVNSTFTKVVVFYVSVYQQALDAAMKQFKSLAPNTAVLLFSEDLDAKKIVCMAQVPQVLECFG